MHEESTSRRKVDDEVHEGAVPAYLLDREQTTRAKVLFLAPDVYNHHVSSCSLLVYLLNPSYAVSFQPCSQYLEHNFNNVLKSYLDKYLR